MAFFQVALTSLTAVAANGPARLLGLAFPSKVGYKDRAMPLVSRQQQETTS